MKKKDLENNAVSMHVKQKKLEIMCRIQYHYYYMVRKSQFAAKTDIEGGSFE